MERARTEGNNSLRDAPNSPQAGHFGATSPLTQPHAVPEWLSSPRRASSSRPVSSESSSPALPVPGLSGHVDRADSISPGSLHRLNVFSTPGTRHVSSEGSAGDAPSPCEDEAALRQELYQQQQADAALPQQTVHQVIRGELSSFPFLCAANNLPHQLFDAPVLADHQTISLLAVHRHHPCGCISNILPGDLHPTIPPFCCTPLTHLTVHQTFSLWLCLRHSP